MNITAEQTAKFNRILDLEDAVQAGKATAAFTGAGTPLFVKARQGDSLASDKIKLDAAISDLTVEEMKLFGEYRLEARR